MPVTEVPLNKLIEHHDNVRKVYDDASLNELADSIEARGVLQSLRIHGGQDGTYQVIAGHRRLRSLLILKKAKRSIKGTKVTGDYPVPVHFAGEAVSDGDATLDMLVENLQREDISAIDEARGYAKMCEEHGHSQRDTAAAVGVSAGHVAKRIALLTLPPELQARVQHQIDIEVGYRISKLDDDMIAKIAKGFEAGKFTANNISYQVLTYEHDVSARRAKEKFDKALEKAMIEPLKDLPVDEDRDLYERVAQYNADNIGEYVPKRNHIQVLAQYNHAIQVYRKLTAKQLEAKRAKQAEHIEQVVAEEQQAEAEWLTEWLAEEATPLEAWEHHAYQLKEQYRGDAKAFEQTVAGALGAFVLDMEPKKVGRVVLDIAVRQIMNVNYWAAKDVCVALGLNPPDVDENGEDIPNIDRAWKKTLAEWVGSDTSKALRAWVADKVSTEDVVEQDAFGPLVNQLIEQGAVIPQPPDLEALLGPRPSDEDEDDNVEADTELVAAEPF